MAYTFFRDGNIYGSSLAEFFRQLTYNFSAMIIKSNVFYIVKLFDKKVDIRIMKY